MACTAAALTTWWKPSAPNDLHRAGPSQQSPVAKALAFEHPERASERIPFVPLAALPHLTAGGWRGCWLNYVPWKMWWITPFSKELHESPSPPPPACSMHVQFGTSLLHMPSALGCHFCLWRTAAGTPMPSAALWARLAWGCAPAVRASRVRVPREARDAVSLAGSRAHSRPSPFGSGASGFGGVAGFGLLLRGSAACAGGLRPPCGNAAV